MTSYTDYLKEKFIAEGEVMKDNFEDLWPEWRSQLEDGDMDKFAYEWALMVFDKTFKRNK